MHDGANYTEYRSPQNTHRENNEAYLTHVSI